MPSSSFTPLVLVLATLTSAAGCIHPAESAGDSARAAGSFAQAARNYDEALSSYDLYGYEKARIWPIRSEMVTREILGELKAPRKGTPRAIVGRLVSLRSYARLQKATPAVWRAIQDAIDVEAMKGLPEIEASAKTKRYGEALRIAALYASEVSEDHPLRARAEALRSEAIAFHKGLASAAKGFGGRLLHARIVEAFGGPSSADAAIAVQKVVGVAWTVDTKESACAALDKGLTKEFASSVGAQGTIVLRLSCQTSKREYDRTETYTYTSRENYQALEEQSRLVAVGNPSTYTVDCPPDVVGQYNTRIRSCSTTETKVSPDYKTEQFEVEVTKSREVELKAQREVHYVEYTTTVNGEIAASAQATGPDENVIFKTSASLNATEKEGSYDQPTRQRIPADFGPHTAEQRVLAKAVGLVRGLLAEVQEGRAIPYVKEAEAAVSAGDRAAAEDSFMIAAEAIGRLAPSFKALLVDTYGFSDVDSASAKSGLHIGEVSRPDKPLEDNPPSTEETSRVDLEFDFLFTRLVSTDAAPQPGREALGGSWQVGSTVLTRIRDTTWGFGLYDFTWLKLYLGGRTAGFTDSTGEEEPGLSGAIEVGYRPYIGYRSSQWGVFLGGRGHLIAQALGNLHQSGALLALAGTVEWRVGGPGVLTLSGWATPAKSGDRTLGGELTLPFGRNGAGLKLAFEKRALSTSLPRTAEESTEYDGIGTRDAVTMSVGLTAWGE